MRIDELAHLRQRRRGPLPVRLLEERFEGTGERLLDAELRAAVDRIEKPPGGRRSGRVAALRKRKLALAGDPRGVDIHHAIRPALRGGRASVMHLARVEHRHAARLEELPRAAQLAALDAPQDEAEAVGVVKVPLEARAQASRAQRLDSGYPPHGAVLDPRF